MIEDVKLFAKRHTNALFVNGIMACICYLHMVFSLNVGIDTERIIQDEGALLDSWKAVGRQGLLLSKAVWTPGGYNPYFAGLLFLAGFILLGAFIAFLCWTVSGKDDSYPYGLFMVLFTVCPAWMPQFYFSLQRTEVVFGMFYAAVSVFALSRLIYFTGNKVIWTVLGLVSGVWSFCTYQGCVAFYIGLCIIIFLMDFARTYEEKLWKEYAMAIFKLIGGFAVIYIVNTVITRLFFGMDIYLQGQIAWGKAPLAEIMGYIVKHIAKVMLWGLGRVEYSSAYPFMCLFLAIVFFSFCRKRAINKSVKFVLFLALAGLALTPFLMTIYTGNQLVARSQFALQLVAAFGCMFAYGIWKKKEGAGYQWVCRAALVICVVVIWLNVSTISRLLYTDDVRYQEDVRVASQIAEDVQRMPGAEGLPIICVGGYGAHLNHAARGADMYGVSFLAWDYTPANLAGATGRVVGIMNTLGIDIAGTLDYQDEAIALSREMEHYPNQGYISVQDNYVIVKLSEIE